jgi:hypothetical protein
VFITYKRFADPDYRLAVSLYNTLTAQGHKVFIDQTMRTGDDWLKEIDEQIKASDYLVVLISEASADSEMVKAEVRRAYEYRKLRGHPHTLPVRVAYEGLLPYSIDVYLESLQYVVWRSQADDERVAYDILATIQGRVLEQVPLQPAPNLVPPLISEDGRAIADEQKPNPPLPEFDPRFLETPGGTVKLQSGFYVRRDSDDDLERHIVQPGTMTTIRAARQTGKSSLLVRGIYYACQRGAKIVHIDLQRLDRDNLGTPERFLRHLAGHIVRRLHLDPGEVDRSWQEALGPQDKITYLMEDYVLGGSDTPIVLAIDEADRLLTTGFHSDFFALVRSWYNSAAYDDLWQKLSVVLVISTEPYLLITDMDQSPFNVGLNLYLEDFSAEQVQDLNQRHGSPLAARDLPQLMELLEGHPYLTRKALYAMIAEKKTWDELVHVAPTDDGPFGDHLRRYRWMLRDQPDLQEALRQVVRHQRCTDDKAFYRLLRAGLVKGSGTVCRCRCDLYRVYFKDRL